MYTSVSVGSDPFDDDLKRRIVAARAAGWSEGDINNFAAQDVMQHRASQVQEQAPSQPAPQRGHGGFLSSLISEFGGAGGAATGAAVGTAIAPGIGTLLGALAGGFFGGTGGRVVENKVRDNRVGLGDALKEGAVSGLLSGAGAGWQLFKGAKAAKNLAKVGLDGLDTAVPRTGVMQDVGNSIKKGSGGYGVGATAKGEEQLTAKGSNAIDEILKRLKVPLGSPESRSTVLGQRLDAIGNKLTGAYSKGVTQLGDGESNNLAGNILDKVLGHPDINLSKPQETMLIDKLSKLSGVKDTSGLWNYVKDIENKGINFGLGADSKLVDKEAINRIFRDEIRQTLNNKVPGVAEWNDLYSHGRTAEKYLLNAARDVKGGGLFGKISTLSPIRAMESKGGDLIEKLGKASAGTGEGAVSGPASQVTRQLKIQAPGDLFKTFTGAPSPSQPSDLLQGNPAGADAVNPSDLFASPDAAMTGTDPGANSSPFTPEVINQMLLDDIQKTGGKNINDIYKILSIQSELGQQAGGPSANVGKVSSQNLSNAQSGISSLGELEQLLQSDPGVLNKSGIPGGSLPLIGGYIRSATGPNVGTFDTLAYNLADKYLRLTTGATANPGEIKNTANKLIPRAGDNPQAVQAKLQTLRQMFSSILQQAQQSGVGTDITNVSGSSGFDPFSQLGYAQ